MFPEIGARPAGCDPRDWRSGDRNRLVPNRSAASGSTRPSARAAC